MVEFQISLKVSLKSKLKLKFLESSDLVNEMLSKMENCHYISTRIVAILAFLRIHKFKKVSSVMVRFF